MPIAFAFDRYGLCQTGKGTDRGPHFVSSTQGGWQVHYALDVKAAMKHSGVCHFPTRSFDFVPSEIRWKACEKIHTYFCYSPKPIKSTSLIHIYGNYFPFWGYLMLIGKDGIFTRLRTGRPKDRGSIPGEGGDYFRYSVHIEFRTYQV